MSIISEITDPLGILDFAKDQYGANRDYEHTREMFDSAQRFDERMSNTAYQRAVTDMEAAGLNPMLAYNQGGASSPSQGAPAINRGSPTGGSIYSAAQVENVRKQTELVEAQRQKVVAETPGAEADSESKRYHRDMVLPLEYRSKQVLQALNILEEQLKSKTLTAEVAARNAEASLREQGVPIELARRQVELLLKKLDVPGARFKARGYGMADRGLKGVKSFAEYAADGAAAVTNSATDAYRALKHGYERFHGKAQFRRKWIYGD